MKSNVLPWIQKGSWTILDQGLFAGSNFILNILLARWLLPAEYGAFVVAFTVFMFVGIVHTGLITEPMLVFGPSRYQNRLTQYLQVLLRGHGGLTILAAIGLGITSLCFFLRGSNSLAGAFLVLSLSQFFILFLLLVRRGCYIELKPKLAATGGILYALCMLPGTYLLYVNERLSPLTALGLMALSSLVAGGWILFRLRVNPFVQPKFSLTQETRQIHWDYGKWASATGAVEWIPSHIAFLLLPVWASLEASAALKALLNFLMPLVNVYGALAMLLVPVLVRARDGGTFKTTISFCLAVAILGSGTYWILLGTFGTTLTSWLYDGLYTEYAHLLWLVGAIPMLSGVSLVLRTALRALERPNLVFWTYLGSSCVAITVSIVLIYLYGIPGALIGFFVQMTIEIVVMIYFLTSKQCIEVSASVNKMRAEMTV